MSGKKIATLSIKVFDRDNDYRMVCDWWEQHKWPVIKLDFLPTMGLVSCVNDMPMAMGWLYIMCAKIFWVEWLVSNPKGTSRDKYKAIEFLLASLDNEGRALGCEMAFSSISSKKSGLIKIYKKCGFHIADKDMVNMIKL